MYLEIKMIYMDVLFLLINKLIKIKKIIKIQLNILQNKDKYIWWYDFFGNCYFRENIIF